MMFGFKEEFLEKDKDFKGSLPEKLGLSEYLCPVCKAHLKKSDGELICLNACHLPKQWQMNFSKKMKEISKAQKEMEQ